MRMHSPLMRIPLLPALQSKLNNSSKRHAAFKTAQPALSEKNILHFISEHRRAYSQRPDFSSNELSRIPPDVTSRLLLHNQDPSSECLRQGVRQGLSLT
jgi:hypothetical protein